MVWYLVAIMDSVVRKAVMLGQSMGTYVDEEVVFRPPDRVFPLIVIDGTCITGGSRLGRP